MPTPIFTGSVKDGKLNLDNRTRFEMYLPVLEGKKVQVVVKKLQQGRSNQQNRYYFGVIVEMLANHTGYDKETMHDNLKQRFASRPDPDHPELFLIEKTSGMNTERFNQYCEDIRRFAAEYFGLYLPDPNECEPG